MSFENIKANNRTADGCYCHGKETASQTKWVGKPIARKDAKDKVLGKTKYMTDLSFPDMLWGKIVRSEVPHARILNIDTTEAENTPGVHAVVTHKDVPGQNAYGIDVEDQPVFAWDKIRYQGEAIAGVIADTKDIAEEAAKKIKLTLEKLPVVSDPRAGMKDDAPKIHESGNVLLHTHVINGDVEKAFHEADVVVENEYFVSMQQQGYLEVEGGVGLYKDGILSIWCGSQYPTQDQRQLSKIMGMTPDKIRVVSNPVGGGFGGKDDLIIQGQLSVMAYKVGKPVKIVHTREESFRTCWKRHPMYMTMKTAARKDGTLLANKVKIISDTGAYAGLGGPVVNLAIEHACGAYRVPNVDLDGYSVYTNNSICSAMRGFGVPQITFAIESQMDLLAEKLDLDPLTIRLKNGLRTGDKAGLGHTLTTAMGTIGTLKKAGETELWKNREKYKKQSSSPWKKRGIGIATSIQGVGLGKGIPDYSAAEIVMDNNGKFRVAIGCPDIGQGNSIAFIQMAAEALRCSLEDINLVAGDTFRTPDSGVTAASRSIYAAGNAIILAAEKIKKTIQKVAARYWDVADDEVVFGDYCVMNRDKELNYREISYLAENYKIKIEARSYFDMPMADISIEGAHGLPHILYGATTHIALVEVNTLTGQVEVIKTVSIPDAGKVINRQGLEGQAEGGAVMGLGYALTEKVVFDEGILLNDNFDTYIMPTALDSPDILVEPVEVLEKSGPFGAKGIGECVTGPIAPSIVNAIYDAVGVRIVNLPADSEKVYFALQGQRKSGVMS